MRSPNSSSILASFATLKSLADEKKYQSPYQILREFIWYVITADSLHRFSATEMKSSLNTHFGFSIPEAVIKTSIKNMDGVSLEHGIYSVSLDEIGINSLFEEKKKEADDYETCIIQLLSNYIRTKTGASYVDEEELTQELARFLTEDVSHHSTRYEEPIIEEFILKNENDKEIQNGLNRIREGSILYLGLSHNIRETGSITKPLFLYLGTEVLFSLAGYNGEIFQQFANDFYEQVRIANSGKNNKLFLYYFSEVKKEVDEFFDSASEIVERKNKRFLDRPAMKEITNGCRTSADVAVKKADFYYKMRYNYGITEDAHDNYYDETHFSTNLEDLEYNDEKEQKRKKEVALKLVSHIHKLRGGNCFENDIDSEHLIVTNTKTTLLISNEQADIIKSEKKRDSICNFAVSLDRITSLLWYKLGNGFSKTPYPSNVRAILKARIVLSSSIAKNAERVYKEANDQYREGVITKEQVVNRIITLRDKPNLPEDLQGDNIEEVMDFSPEYLSRCYDEQLKNTRDSLKEKEEKITSQKLMIDDINNENAQLKEENEKYKLREVRNSNVLKLLKFIGCILIKILIIAAITVIALCLKIPSQVFSVIDILGLIYTVWSALKKDREKYLLKTDEI